MLRMTVTDDEEDNMRLQTMMMTIMTVMMVMIRNRMKMIMMIMVKEMEDRPVSLTLLLGCCSQIEGCPTYDLWDRKKNFSTVKPYFLENDCLREFSKVNHTCVHTYEQI